MRARIFFAILLFTGSLYATTVQRLSLEDLVRRAHTIVAGRVVNSRTYWSTNRRLIYTNYTIQVDETIKGQSSRSIEVTTIGGKIGDVELHVAGMPSFQSGETAVVFVEQSAGFQTVLGLGQGKFTVTNGEVTNSVGDLSFPDGRPGALTRMPVQNFKDQIRKLLSR
ncbi:MAG TPA: hypothetical protein VGK48_01225 [Terriglobia bacterium]|jgi:hypothetical protein